jgi:hypothetical protein
VPEVIDPTSPPGTPASLAGYQLRSEKNVPGGYAGLDQDGHLISGLFTLPDIESGVASVNGQTGIVTLDLSAAGVGLGNVENKTEAQRVASGPIADALAGKQAANTILDTLTSLTPTEANNYRDISAYMSGLLDNVDASALQTDIGMSTFVKTLIDDANAGAFLTTLGISSFVQGLLDETSAANFMTQLGISSFAQGILDETSAANFQNAIGISAFVRGLLDDADASTFQSSIGISTFVKSLLDDVDASTFLSTLGVSTFIKGLLDDTTAGAALTTLGVSPFMQTVLDDPDATTAIATLGGVDAAALNRVVKTAVTNDYTADAGDAGRVIQMNKATSPNPVVTLPANVFANDQVLHIYQLGTQTTDVAAGAGLSLRRAPNLSGGFSLNGRYSWVSIYYRATTEAIAFGDYA